MKNKFPALTNEEIRQRLEPPTGKIRMVLDTDTYNEVDDQFALAYALLSENKLNIEAVYAAPFSSTFFQDLLKDYDITVPMVDDIKKGLDQSYNEILNIFNLLSFSSENKVFKGSASYMKNPGRPVESAAARDLVEKAMSSDELLYVVAIGEITNVASAIMMEPEIIKKLVVVWLGGHPLYWPHTLEFNLGQDLYASQFMFDCGVPIVLVPCMSVASHLVTTKAELNENLNGKSKIGSYLSDIVISQLSEEAAKNMFDLFRYSYLKGVDDYSEEVNRLPIETMACSRIIWDISTIGYLINPAWCPSSIVNTPILTDDVRWKLDDSRHPMRICHYVQRDAVFGDMFKKLANAD